MGKPAADHGEEKALQLDFFSSVFVSKVPELFSLSLLLSGQEFIKFPDLLGFTFITENCVWSFLVLSHFLTPFLSLFLLPFPLTISLLYFSFLYRFG